jgi:hypothetical protein
MRTCFVAKLFGKYTAPDIEALYTPKISQICLRVVTNSLVVEYDSTFIVKSMNSTV